jgi:hypothetical protein
VTQISDRPSVKVNGIEYRRPPNVIWLQDIAAAH